MIFQKYTIALETCNPIELVDITSKVNDALTESGVQQGQAIILSQHTTAFININEKENRLLEDMTIFLKRLVPRDGDYLHNLQPLDGRDNAHAHLLGLFMNSSETIPVADGKLMIGRWQSIFFVELDGPRLQRNVLLQISGI
ncbi:MAG: YjbQ family protein [Chlorobiaceae bacterium]|jgi:secondary thiamine-phosphate synthase enzyme|nr:YjbQ family protein [Chlorobiaceae bacterium]NTW63786.1 YjbQ family protein [Chlorobiaceae bacterium]